VIEIFLFRNRERGAGDAFSVSTVARSEVAESTRRFSALFIPKSIAYDEAITAASRTRLRRIAFILLLLDRSLDLIETAVLVLLPLALGTDAGGSLVSRGSSYEFDRYKVSRRYSNLSENSSAALKDVFPVSSVLTGQPPLAVFCTFNFRC
jgi:hypothetical protein